MCMYQAPRQGLKLISHSHSERFLWAAMIVGTGMVILLVYCLVWTIEWYRKEPIIPYELETPKRQEERKILDNPSIKV